MTQSKYIDVRPSRQTAFNLLPAVVLGGPPHSGKSVLAYSLSQTLRRREVPHYVLRAYPPDGEGDWFLDVDAAWVRHLRVKGARSEAWLPPLQRDIARRHLPLLVDMGGLPTPEQEALLDACTHGVLLTPDAASHQTWQARFARHGLVLLADLHSDLHGENRLAATTPVVRGTLAGLERGQSAHGPAFEALVTRLARLFRAAGRGLRHRHLASAPAELTVDLEQLADALRVAARAWQPQDLPRVLDYLPEGQALALYGRGPNWLYAAAALHARPAACYVFDARLGWVLAPELAMGTSPADALLHVQRERTPDGVPEGVRLTFNLPEAYLDIEDVDAVRVPRIAPGTGLLLSGKLPHWLGCALVRAYAADARWIAVFQPQVQGSVVVQAGADKTVGEVIG